MTKGLLDSAGDTAFRNSVGLLMCATLSYCSLRRVVYFHVKLPVFHNDFTEELKFHVDKLSDLSP